MSSVRPPAGGGARLVFWAVLAACLTGVTLTASGILGGRLAQALVGASLATVCGGIVAGLSRRVPEGGRAGAVPGGPPAAYAGLRPLKAAVVLIVGVFVLALTASVTSGDSAAGRTLVRATAWLALAVSFGTLGFALVMVRDPQGRHRPDWVFVVIAVVLLAVTLVQLYDRLALIFFID